MCFEVVKCAECGEWLDEFNASAHQCKSIPVQEEKKEIEIEQPVLVPISKRNKRATKY